MMKFQEFEQLSQQGNVVAVYQTYLADLLTPVSAFMKLQQRSRQAFLFESVEGGEKTARFSFLGCDPFKTVQYRDGQIEETAHGKRRRLPGDIFTYLKELFGQYRAVQPQGLPRFTGGAVGYFGYETIRLIEDVPVMPNGPQSMPDAVLMLFDTILAFDHLKHQIFIIKNVRCAEEQGSLAEQFDRANAQIDTIKQLLDGVHAVAAGENGASAAVHCNFGKEEFCRAVQTAQEHITAGDIFQVVLSQQFSRSISVDPFEIYRALRIINPSPYLYFIRMDDRCIIGSSPELLVRVENGTVEVRPIAGTRKRGQDEQEDQALMAELQQDEKELAEHTMLVDLGRNDLGRVCDYGTVQVSEFVNVEKYSHVMHLVSNVVGKLRQGLTAIEALKACFPAGTVSGAPKIRAMEIISELEPVRRGVYAGALGYLDFSGNLDTCIAIRTIVTEGDQAFFQAGAGIVADSVPEREFDECLHKAAALRAAIDFAERGLK